MQDAAQEVQDIKKDAFAYEYFDRIVIPRRDRNVEVDVSVLQGIFQDVVRQKVYDRKSEKKPPEEREGVALTQEVDTPFKGSFPEGILEGRFRIFFRRFSVSPTVSPLGLLLLLPLGQILLAWCRDCALEGGDAYEKEEQGAT